MRLTRGLNSGHGVCMASAHTLAAPNQRDITAHDSARASLKVDGLGNGFPT
jgi:hypothetical protein